MGTYLDIVKRTEARWQETSLAVVPEEVPQAISASPQEQSSESNESFRESMSETTEEDTPAQYWSDMLHEHFWVAPTPAYAATLSAQGQVAYQPDEIWHLRDLKARNPHAFPAKLRAIHQAKTVFGATVTQSAT